MYDTQYPSIVPKSADLVASYVDGPQASNFDQAQQIFGSKALSITWTGEPADIADVEGGFAMSKLPEWIKQQQDAGIPKPVIYAIYSGVGTNYQQVKKAVGSAKVSWWLSDWTGKPHTLPGADAVQYGAQASPSSPMITDPSQAGGHTYDLSFVSSSFPYYGGAPHVTPAKAPAAPAAHAGGTRGTGAAPAPVISVGAPGGACGEPRRLHVHDDRAALFKPGLPGHDFVHLAFEGIPLEQLPARSFTELGARFGQTVLVSRLHFRLPREDCAHQVVVEGDIDRDGGGPGERDERERGKGPDADAP